MNIHLRKSAMLVEKKLNKKEKRRVRFAAQYHIIEYIFCI